MKPGPRQAGSRPAVRSLSAARSGGTHRTVITRPAWDVTASWVGANGANVGVPITAAEAAPGPARFTARKRTAYGTPHDRFRITRGDTFVGCPPVVHVPPLLMEYLVVCGRERWLDRQRRRKRHSQGPFPGVMPVIEGGAGVGFQCAACRTAV